MSCTDCSSHVSAAAGAPSSHPLASALHAGVQALGLSLSAHQQAQLLAYMNALLKWNRVYNLTAIRQPAEALTHHVLDSLTAIAPLQRQAQAIVQVGSAASADVVPLGLRVLDVGSGGGLPGVVVAICCPHWQVVCVDAVAKKTAFIQQVAAELGLENLQARHARIEMVQEQFDVITSRAFATLADFTNWSAQALHPHGVWLAMKGKPPHDEVQQLGAAVDVFHVEQVHVPGLDAQRCLVWMRPRPH